MSDTLMDNPNYRKMLDTIADQIAQEDVTDVNWDEAPVDAQWHTTDISGRCWWKVEPQLIGQVFCWHDDESECDWYNSESWPISITRRPEANHDAA